MGYMRRKSAVVRERLAEMSRGFLVISLAYLLLGATDVCAVSPAAASEVPQVDRTREFFVRYILTAHEIELPDLSRAKQLTGVKKYLSLAYRRGLSLTRGATLADFEKPVPLTATFHITDNNETQLGFFWLGSKDTVRGVYIQNRRGNVIAAGDIESIFDGNELIQIGAVFISVNGKPAPAPTVSLDAKRLDGQLWVGLVQIDGSRTKAVEAYVAKALRAAPNAGQKRGHH